MGHRLSKEVDYESAGCPFESGRARQFESEKFDNLAPWGVSSAKGWQVSCGEIL